MSPPAAHLRPPLPAPDTTHPLRAAVTMLVAVAVLSLMDVGLKLLSTRYPPLQVAALRGASSLPFVLAWALVTVGPRSLLRVRWPLHLLRGGLSVGMMASFVYALRTLPLTTTYSIFFVAPLLVAALAVPLLGERVGPRRWVAIVLGMVGVLVLLRPDVGGPGAGWLSLAALAALFGAVCYAVGVVTVRVLGRTDSTESMMVWMLLLLALGAGALAAPGWVPIAAADGWIILGVGLAGALGQYAITEAFRLGEASAIAPLDYTALVWGVLLDVAIWNTWPDAMTWLGAAIIVASGLYLLRRERVRAEPDAA